MAGKITHSWNGTVLTITSDSGTSSADLKGDMGVRGPQGVAGVVDATKFYHRDNPPTIDEVGAAPAGYGLGVGSWSTGGYTRYTNASDLDLMFWNGFWAYQSSGNPLEPNHTQTQFVYGITLCSGGKELGKSGFAVQRGFTCYTRIWIEREYLYSSSTGVGKWSEWRYINPPMANGVEYLTNEQNRNGEFIYRKRIIYTNPSALGANGTMTELSFPHNIENFGALVRVDGTVGTTQPIPYLGSSGNMTVVSTVNATNVIIRTQSGWLANCSWVVDIAYTKSA